jgi:transposase
MRHPGITRHMRDLDRLKTIQAVIDRELKPGRAAERLGLTVRQVERLVLRYRAEGPLGLISRHRNRTGNRALKAPVAEHVVEILREQYADFGPTLATEKLRSRHNIVIAKETVRQLQIASGLWIPRKLRPPKVQQPRSRRACWGELVQIDGCEHRWFEDRAPACTALVYVDDATSRLMVVHFTGSESTFAYFGDMPTLACRLSPSMPMQVMSVFETRAWPALSSYVDLTIAPRFLRTARSMGFHPGYFAALGASTLPPTIFSQVPCGT